MMTTTPTERRGDWSQVYTGTKFYALDPREDDIFIEDIAHALANFCRWGGHTSSFYSVAQHSVLVSYRVPPEHRPWALLHDASEAYLGDIVRPLKLGPGFDLYREAEAQLEEMICRRFELAPPPMPEEVKKADDEVLLAEARDLMGNPPWIEQKCLVKGLAPWPVQPIRPWAPATAKVLFLRRFKSLFPCGGLLGQHPAARTSLDNIPPLR